MRLIATLCFLIVACSKPLEPTQWVKVAQSADGLEASYNSNNMEHGGSKPFVIRKTLTDYKKTQTTEGGNMFTSYVSENVLKCGFKLWSPISVDYYSGNMATGKIIEHNERSLKEAENDLYQIDVGSKIETTYKETCSHANFK